MSLRVRHRVTEWMEQPQLDRRMHHCALDGLRRVNQRSGSSAILWPPIRQLARQVARRPLRILDIGSGGGDVALAIARRAQRAGIEACVHGCDISPVAVEHARALARTAKLDRVRFVRLDALAEPLPANYDVLMCSLLLHHFDEAEAARLLRKMSRAARHLVLVSDLRRSRPGYLLAWIGCRLLTRSPIIHADGPLSVAAAFTLDEAWQIARQGGLGNAVIVRRWPERLLIIWRRP